MRLGALLVVAVAACSHAGIPRPSSPEPEAKPVVEPLAPPITLVIADLAISYSYGEIAPTSDDAVIGSGPRHDPRLDAAAAELLEVVHQGAALSPELVRRSTPPT